MTNPTPTIPVFSAVELAQKSDMTRQAIHDRARKGKIQKIALEYKDNTGKSRTGKFYIPEDFQVIHSSQYIGIDDGEL
jgi:predicted DNA-binding protein YlxM (UPF0122 family)